MIGYIRAKIGLLAIAVALLPALPAVAQAAPDLTVNITSVSPQSARPNARVTVATTVRNVGSSPANFDRRRSNRRVNHRAIYMVRWVFKKYDTGPDRLIAAMKMSGTLNPGQSRTLTPSPRIPADARAGSHTICAIVDPENRVRERSERNNRSCVHISVPSQISATVGGVIAHRCSSRLLRAPHQISPLNGATFNYYPRTTRFRWSAVRNAKTYGIEIDCMHCCVQGKWCTDVGRTWLVKNGLTSAQFVHNFVGAQPGRWRIWATDACGRKGAVSGWWTFRYTK